jgi:hypothetical protein
MKNIENVRRYRKDICEALEEEFKEEDIDTDYFLGEFRGEQKDYLNSLGLINRGFCPLCGEEPIGNEYYRGIAFSNVVQYLCKDCYERTNPHLNVPGYTRRYYTAKFVMWAIGIGILVGTFLLIRGCFRFLF